MDPIKEAFSKVKEDIISLRTQLTDLKIQLEEIKRTLQQTNRPTDRQITPTNQQITPTHDQGVYPLKPQNSGFSTGNDGVPTDRQTDQQTDRHVSKFAQSRGSVYPLSPPSTSKPDAISSIEKASQILESLDEMKKEIRSQFKRLTNQEMLIFSTIYQLEDQGLQVDYPLLAEKLNLSESSIRDYVLKIMKKGIPLGKVKENNKKVTLSILPEIRKIASLQTILSLREI
jgi:hypothetical protein